MIRFQVIQILKDGSEIKNGFVYDETEDGAREQVQKMMRYWLTPTLFCVEPA